LSLLKKHRPVLNDILDLGCANENLLLHLRELYPDAKLEGVEISPVLCEIANEQLAGVQNVKITNEDILQYAPSRQFDCIIAEGVHSIFEDPVQEIERWSSWLNDDGILMIFGIFCPVEMDFRFHYRNIKQNHGWESGFNAPSLDTLKIMLQNNNLSCLIEPFEANFDLPKEDDPIKSYTEKVSDKNRFILADSLIINFYHIIIQKK
jgi:trans-aconitate methyltransferase